MWRHSDRSDIINIEVIFDCDIHDIDSVGHLQGSFLQGLLGFTLLVLDGGLLSLHLFLNQLFLLTLLLLNIGLFYCLRWGLGLLFCGFLFFI